MATRNTQDEKRADKGATGGGSGSGRDPWRRQLWMEQLEERVDGVLTDVLLAGRARWSAADEALATCQQRLRQVTAAARALWNDNGEAIAAAAAAGPRYVEGFPAYLQMQQPPRFALHVPQRMMDWSGRRCLQCQAKRMRCSQERRSWVVDESRWPDAPCRRCRRNGDECLTWRPVGRDEKEKTDDADDDDEKCDGNLRGWMFAEVPARFARHGDDAAVRREMWAAERRLARELCDVRDRVRAEVIGAGLQRVGRFAPATSPS